jgi:hypothetical protein
MSMKAGQELMELTQRPSKHLMGALSGQLAISHLVVFKLTQSPEEHLLGASSKQPTSLGQSFLLRLQDPSGHRNFPKSHLTFYTHVALLDWQLPSMHLNGLS